MLKNKQKEIEIKLVYKNKNVVTKVLKKLKAKYLGKKLIHDRYYSQKYKDMKNIHQLLRIREINNKKSELTLKGKCKDKNNVWQRTELTLR